MPPLASLTPLSLNLSKGSTPRGTNVVAKPRLALESVNEPSTLAKSPREGVPACHQSVTPLSR